MIIPLTKGYVAEIEDADAPMIAGLKFHAQKDRSGNVYARTTINGHKVYLHNIIYPPPPSLVVDHIDGNPLKCTRANMRHVTGTQNRRNRRVHKNSQIGYKGVSAHKQKWRVRLYHDGEIIRLHGFDTPEAAALAYNALAVEMFGEYARLNVVI